MDRQVVAIPGATQSAPFSLGVKAGGLLFVSGHTGRAADGAIPPGIEDQTRLCLEGIRRVVEAAGLTMAHVVKTTVFVTDMAQFGRMNEVYRTYFPAEPPARSTVGISALARPEMLVEIEAVAVL
jgi:2-iminobutanoate/2-iminopropanoate deaminase